METWLYNVGECPNVVGVMIVHRRGLVLYIRRFIPPITDISKYIKIYMMMNC